MWCWSTLCFVYSSGICARSLVFKSLSLVSIISYFYFRSCIYLSMTSCHIYAKENMILCRNVSKKNLIWNFPLGVILLCMVWCYKFLLGIAIVVFTPRSLLQMGYCRQPTRTCVRTYVRTYVPKIFDFKYIFGFLGPSHQ